MVDNTTNYDHMIRAEQITPLIGVLNPETVQWLKREAGFPNEWSEIQVSSWLGGVFDRMTFRVNQDDRYIVPTMYLETSYEDYNNLEYYSVMIPIYGFNFEYMRYLHYSMLNIDINSMEEWLNYLNRGGRDRFMVRIRRYQDNLPNNIYSNYN